MTTYNNKKLNHYKAKSGGKNNSEVDGFYNNSDNEHFFIKKPADKNELFTELFAGLLLQEFKNRKIIDEVYFPSLICADVIRFDDGSYGLIQPLVTFDELHKVIGTSYSDGSDRDPTKEAFFGPSYYTGVTKIGDSFGLSVALMFSLLLGAHSVHSGNIVLLKADEKSKSRQYGRIDWGDAFRYFAHEQNNKDILYAYENRGFFNIKSLTKDYFLNYKKINGLFPAMADKAQKILPLLNAELLTDIVSSALKKIPADLIDKTTQNKLADYMVMPSLKEVLFGSEGTFEPFAAEMGTLLERRMISISELQNIQAQAIHENLYSSVIFVEPQILSFKDLTSFPELLKLWADSIASKSTVKTDTLDLTQLTNYFNQYVTDLAEKTESAHLWDQDPSNTYNVFTEYHSGDGKQLHGHAFVPQYKESTIIKRFFTLDTHTFGALRFAAFEHSVNEYTKTHQDSDWAKIQELLQTGQQVINTLDVLNKAREFGMDDAVTIQMEQLRIQLKIFVQAETAVQQILSTPHEHPLLEQNRGSSFFYPIDDQELNVMTGDQLATICLEELNSSVASSLVERIIKNDKLWYRMDDAFESGAYNSRLDEARGKILTLRNTRALITASQEQTGKQISELEHHIELLNSQMATRTEAAEQLNNELLKQLETTKFLQEQVEELKLQTIQSQTIKDQLEQSTPQIKVLQQQLEHAQKQKQSSLSEHLDELNRFEEQFKAQELLMNQVQEELRVLKDANESLKSTLAVENELRTLSEKAVMELHDKLQQSEEQLQQLNKKNTQQHTELSQLQLKTEQTIQLLTAELKEQKEQCTQLNQQLDIKDQTILELSQKLSEAALEVKPSEEALTEDLKREAEAKLLQEQLKTEIAALQSAHRKDKSEIGRLNMLIHSAKEAEKNYESALKDKKDICFARMERMLPIMQQIQRIEHKADELAQRDEAKASQEAYKLAHRLRADIKEYAESEEKNEDVALNNFKIKAADTVAKSKDVLSQHREEWKYILANITLGVLLVGVGYVAAILINKQITGNYTFFSKTESTKQLEEVEQSIAAQVIPSFSGG